MLNVLDPPKEKKIFWAGEKVRCSLRDWFRMFFQKASKQGKGMFCASVSYVDRGISMGIFILVKL